MRLNLKKCLGGMAILALALPLWAHTDSSPLNLSRPAIIAGTQLQPGHYDLKVSPDQKELRVVQNNDGKVVAEVPCKWVNLSRKAPYTAVVMNKNKVTEVEFNGKMQAVKIS